MKKTAPLAEKQIERERMQDVLLLVEHLVASQETTFKLIIDCLYDVGSVSLINQKVKMRALGRLSKLIASTSKPMFRLIAFYWVKRNCPQLITNWLYRKATFGQRDLSQLDYSREVVAQAIAQYEQEKKARESAPSSDPLSSDEQSTSSNPSTEIKRLQGQVKILQGMLLGVSLALGGATAWILSDLRPQWSNTTPSVESVTLDERCTLISAQMDPSLKPSGCTKP